MAHVLQPLTGQRQSSESNKAVVACNDYLRMGPGRSLRELHRKYDERATEKAPVKALRTIGQWSSDFNWVKRAEEYDQQIQEQKKQYAEEMLKSGLALDYERVSELKKLYELLLSQLMEQGSGGVLHNLWVPDVKQIGSGEYSERVDIEHYNSSLISDIRGLLDDLAKETGGRVKKSELSGADGSAITLKVIYENKDIPNNA